MLYIVGSTLEIPPKSNNRLTVPREKSSSSNVRSSNTNKTLNWSLNDIENELSLDIDCYSSLGKDSPYLSNGRNSSKWVYINYESQNSGRKYTFL